MQAVVNIDSDGRLSFVYRDELADLLELGVPTLARASHIEPGSQGGWVADLAPVDGPVAGPFRRHALAAEFEVQWIESHHLGSGTGGRTPAPDAMSRHARFGPDLMRSLQGRR